MRMLVLTLALTPAAASAQEPVTLHPKSSAECQNARAMLIEEKEKPAAVQKLAEQPRANAYFLVQSFVEGCDKPVMVSEVVETQR